MHHSGMILKRRELPSPGSLHKLNRTETQHSVTEADVIDDVRRTIGLKEEVENEDEQDTHEVKVTVPWSHETLKAMEYPRGGSFFRSVIEWI